MLNIPSCNYAHSSAIFKLKNYAEFSPRISSPKKLKTIFVFLIASHFKFAVKALNCLINGNSVCVQFISFMVVLEYFWGKIAPFWHDYKICL